MRRAERQPTSELTLYAGIYCKRWTIPDAGVVIPQHAHGYDHLTYIVSGSVRLWRGLLNELDGDYHAPCAIRIPARTRHMFQALEPTVLLCLHNIDHAEADGEPPIHAENTIVNED